MGGSPNRRLLFVGVHRQCDDVLMGARHPAYCKFGFRANDGTEINTRELPTVIDLVESIVKRFAVLPGP